MPIELITGDITKQEVDAIVNSANPSLLAGGGVCGAIHSAAGPELEAACEVIGGCAKGSAVITPGFNLKAKYVIHAVTERWYGGKAGELDTLDKCYRSIFEIVKSENLNSVALPAIGTGIYCIPFEQAIAVAINVTEKYAAALPDLLIRFVPFNEDISIHYLAELYGREGLGFRFNVTLDKAEA